MRTKSLTEPLMQSLLNKADNATTQLAALMVAVSLSGVAGAQFVDIKPILLSGGQVPVLQDGAVYKDFISIKCNEWGNLAICATFQGEGVDSTNDVGILSLPIAGAPELIAREGTTINGLPADAMLGAINYHFRLHNSGHISFRGYLSGAGLDPSSDHGVYTTQTLGTLTTIGRTNGPTPDQPDTSFSYLSIPSTNSTDTFLVNTRIEGPSVDPAFDSVVYLFEPGNEPQPLVYSGLPVNPLDPDTVIESISSSQLDPLGNTWSLVTLAGPMVDSSNDDAIIATSPDGTITLVARKGDAVPGFPIEAYYNVIISYYDHDESGNVYFSSSLARSGSTGSYYTLFRATTNGDPVALVSTGQQAPGLPNGVTFFAPTPLDTEISLDGRLAFESSLSGAPNSSNRALFMDLGQGLTSIAREGDSAPGPHHPATYADFNVIRINRTGGAAFRARLDGLDDALFGVTPTAEVLYIVGVSDIIDIDPLPGVEDFRTVADVVELGSIELLDSGLLYYKLAFQDGTSGIFATQLYDTCRADTNGDGILSPADFSAWVAAFNSQVPACDQNNDGKCSAADFSAWVANYNAGC